jgi:hypothetical protein
MIMCFGSFQQIFSDFCEKKKKKNKKNKKIKNKK